MPRSLSSSPSEASSAFASLLEEAWLLRLGQELNLCKEKVNQLLALLPTECSRLLSQAEYHAERKEFIFTPQLDNLMLLLASLARNEGRVTYADVLFNRAESCLRLHPNGPGYYYYFELGLRQLNIGKYSLALESFTQSRLQAHGLPQQLASQCNLLVALDAVGECSLDSIQELESLLPKEEQGSWKTQVQAQINTLSARNAFRNAQFEEAFPRVKPSTLSPSNHYWSLYMSALPYVELETKAQKPLVSIGQIQSFGQTYQLGYRMRTVLGMATTEDAIPRRMSEWVDRIYLWLWKAIASTPQATTEFLGQFAPFKTNIDAKSLSLEDTILLGNTLLWLCYFDRSVDALQNSNINPWLNTQPPIYPLFDFERHFIHYLIALRDGKEDLASNHKKILENHALYTNQGFGIPKLLTQHFSSPFDPMYLSYCHISRLLPVPRIKGGITLWQESQKIVNTEGNQEKTSKKLCDALALLAKQPSLSIDKFCQEVFGISNYDSSLDGSRLFRLLKELRSLCTPHLSFKLRAGKIECEGDLDKLDIVEASALTLALQKDAVWRAFKEGALSNASTTVATLRVPQKGEVLSRKFLEINFKRPRATINRWLNEWVDKKIVEAVGRGRSTQYEVLKPIPKHYFLEKN